MDSTEVKNVTESYGNSILKGKNWNSRAKGVKEEKIFHAKEADREVYIIISEY